MLWKDADDRDLFSFFKDGKCFFLVERDFLMFSVKEAIEFDEETLEIDAAEDSKCSDE